MTQASTTRVANRLNGTAVDHVIDGRAFELPPAGQLAEEVRLIDFGLVLGIVHPEGSPLLIAAWDGQRMRYLLPEKATMWADGIALIPELAPVTAALRKLVKRAADIAAASLMVTAGSA